MSSLSSDKMRDMPIGKLILTMSLPAMLSMLVKALYNIVDSIYISHYSLAGLNALSIVFPLQTIVIAMSIAIGVGTNAMVARKLGERNREEANFLAGNGLFLTICGFLFVLVLGLVFPRTFLGWFTNDIEVINAGVDYLTIILCFSFGVFVDVCLCRILQAMGNMHIPMISQIMGAIINIVLDPIFIFGFWFVPEMGISGAAIATIIAQVSSMTFVIIVFFSKKRDVSLAFRFLQPQWQYIKEIFKIGFPSFVMSSINSFATSTINFVLKPFPYAITIHGIYFKIRSFVFMPVFGMTQGLMPILSYNYGANAKARFLRARNLALLGAVCILSVGSLLFFGFTKPLLSLFNLHGDIANIGTYALRVLALSFVSSAFCIISSVTLQSLGNAFSSLLITLSRQMLLNVPFAFILAHFYGFDGVFFCYLIAESLVAIVAYPYQRHITLKRFKKKAALETEATG